MSQTYKGNCFCGAVEVTVTGEPAAEGFCHCSSCRSWAAAPVNAFTLWKPEAVKVTKGEGNVGVYHKTEKSYRKFCKICGGHLFTEHPPLGSDRRLRRHDPDPSPRAEASCQLSGNRAPHQGRPAQDEGHAQGDGRVGRDPPGVACFGQCIRLAEACERRALAGTVQARDHAVGSR